MNAKLEELVRIAERFPHLNKQEIKSFIHLQNVLDDELEEYEKIKQTTIIVANDKISDEDLKKLITQRLCISNSQPCEIKPLFDEEAQKKLRTVKDVEQMLGVDLCIWATAMHDGVYVKGKEPEWSGLGSSSKKTIEHYDVVYFTKNMLAVRFNNFCDIHYIDSPMKAFRRVWALSKTDFISSKKEEMVGVEPSEINIQDIPFFEDTSKTDSDEKLAIDIIKKKSVNCRLLIDCKTSLHRYNKMCCQARQLTEYEFEVLLKVLTGGIVCHS